MCSHVSYANFPNDGSDSLFFFVVEKNMTENRRSGISKKKVTHTHKRIDNDKDFYDYDSRMSVHLTQQGSNFVGLSQRQNKYKCLNIVIGPYDSRWGSIASFFI